LKIRNSLYLFCHYSNGIDVYPPYLPKSSSTGYCLSIFTDLWGCPPGYFMLEMRCYKQFRTAKAFADAELICQNDGGFLAKPVTLLQVNYLDFAINEILFTKKNYKMGITLSL